MTDAPMQQVKDAQARLTEGDKTHGKYGEQTGHDRSPNSILTCPLNTVVCRITVNHFKSFCSLPAKRAGPRVRRDIEITVSSTVHPALLMPPRKNKKKKGQELFSP